MGTTFGVVDLFAGPGGLGEGFSSFLDAGGSPFRTEISVEMEASAHRTLRLRAFLRAYQTRHGRLPPEYIDFHAGVRGEPEWSEVDARAWEHATNEAQCLELGTVAASDAIDEAVARLRSAKRDAVLIGGPPCQAYSLVGRARSRGKRDYVPEQDLRHYLFREYISVLDRLRPAVFVMENVKGMLSSSVESRLVFEMLMEDLSSLGASGGQVYELRAIRVEGGQALLREAAQATDFIVRADEFGVPQRRHRVIIVGIRSDIAHGASRASIRVPSRRTTVYDAIGTLPRLRSGLSREDDSADAWRAAVAAAARELAAMHRDREPTALHGAFAEIAESVARTGPPARSSSALPPNYGRSRSALAKWLERPGLSGLAQHETRGHMRSDLGRYLFAAVFAERIGYSPKADEFPAELSPEHRNWQSGVFDDRFRVQLAGEPSTTVTSHISKDGHYFIHPDPFQCRSLTVREAARLQTFPDDYLFLGNRTQQYVQVGNAVPPLLARAIAGLVCGVLTSA